MEQLDPMTLKPTGGFAAITPKMPDGPLAITKIIRGPDGQMQTVYVDARTGQELGSLNGYTIWNSQNYLDPNFTEPEGGDEKPQTAAKETVAEAKDVGPGGRFDSGFGGYQTKAGSQFHGEQKDYSSDKPKGDVQNNYGYIDKPAGMGFANMLPGPLGMAAKAINTGINMNNVSAVNEARKSIGLEDQGFMGRLGGTLKDKHGQVANVTLGDENYSVGFEAVSPTGRTNLTPQEARQRMNYGLDLKETPKEEVEEDQEAFEKEFGSTGFFASVRDTVSSIFDAVNPFNDDDVDTKSFPDAPQKSSGASGRGESSYDGKSYSGQNAGQDTPSERSGIGRGSQMRGGATGASTSEANRGGRGVTAGGTGLW